MDDKRPTRHTYAELAQARARVQELEQRVEGCAHAFDLGPSEWRAAPTFRQHPMDDRPSKIGSHWVRRSFRVCRLCGLSQVADCADPERGDVWVDS